MTDTPSKYVAKKFRYGQGSKLALSKRRLRMAIHGRKGALSKVDKRALRRLGILLNSHLSDLGGEGNVSHAERVLVDRCSMMTMLCELQEADFVAQNLKIPATELQSYLALNSALTRNLQTLGLTRRAKQVPSVQQYLRDKEQEAVDADAAE